MKKIYLLLLMISGGFYAIAQRATPLYEVYFSDPDRMVEDDAGGYHFNVKDGNIVYMSDEGHYKLTDSRGAVIEEGGTDEENDQYIRDGSWKEYYSSGKIKAEGAYFRGNAYGQWKLYNSDGVLQTAFTIIPVQTDDNGVVYCKAGQEQVFYENGNIKEDHFYKAEPFEETEVIKVEDPETEKKVSKTITKKSYRPAAFGSWIYYAQDGTVEREEEKK